MPSLDAATALVVGLARIRETDLTLEVTVSPDALHLPHGEDAVVTRPVQVQGRLSQVSGQVYFRGTIRGSVTMPCSRCLEETPHDLVTETEVLFLPPASGEADQVEPEELDVYEHDGMCVDLRPLVREQVVLAFPVQPLCAEDCAGLCQVCGSNRNVEPCRCQTAEGDSRFAVLRQLRHPTSS